MPHGQTFSRRCGCPAVSSNRFAGGKRRPALVVADLTGDDLILCQITSQSRRHDSYSIQLRSADFHQGRLNLDSFIRTNRLFTIEQAVVLYSAAKVKTSKLDEVRAKIRELFS